MRVEGITSDVAIENLHAYAYSQVLNNGEGADLSRLLDVGIGDGVCLRRALSWGGFTPELLVGLDKDETVLKLTPKELGVSPVKANGVFLPFRDNVFSVVTACQIIEHIQEEEHHQFVQELFRVVEPGGRVLIATLNKNFPHNVKGHKDHVAEYDSEKIKNLVTTAQQFGGTELFVVEASERFVRAQQKRAALWFLRPIKDLVPRIVKDATLVLLTRGEMQFGIDLRNDFQVKKYREFRRGEEEFTDFLIVATKQ